MSGVTSSELKTRRSPRVCSTRSASSNRRPMNVSEADCARTEDTQTQSATTRHDNNRAVLLAASV